MFTWHRMQVLITHMSLLELAEQAVQPASGRATCFREAQKDKQAMQTTTFATCLMSPVAADKGILYVGPFSTSHTATALASLYSGA